MLELTVWSELEGLGCEMVMRTGSFSGGILSPTAPTGLMDGWTDSWCVQRCWLFLGHFSYGNLYRNIFSLKQKATVFRISLKYSHHNLLRAAGEAILGTNFSIPGLRFVSCWWGSKVPAEEQQFVRDMFPKFQKTDFRECSIPCTKQLHSHHFTLKACQQTEDRNSPHIQDSYDRFQAEKLAFTLCITHLMPCHTKQYSMKLCCQNHFGIMHSPQCILRIQNGAFKNASAFF